MRLNKSLVHNTVIEVVGEDAIPLVEYLKGKEEISEFKIARDIREEIHNVRNILYKLNNYHLAIYTRKKDKIKGWYISYWSLNLPRFKEIYARIQKEKVSRLKDKLKREQEYREGLYLCPNLCSRMNFEEGMEFMFKCPECGSLLHKQDNTKTIEHIKSMIEQIEAIV
ncbi:hypothetical protein JW930_05180 [Candidatus Woesearchaeota archaeon]|nr:hypothetical protein [Candidatus Woesearchaeota archaeon]